MSAELFPGEQGLQVELLKLLKEARVYNEANDYVNLDELWVHGWELFKAFAATFGDYLEALRKATSFSRIVVPDKAGLPVAMLRLATVISVTKDIPSTVWREFDDIPRSESRFYGPLEKNEDLLLLDDVMSRGTTTIKILVDLERLGYHPRKVQSLVLIEMQTGGEEFIKKKASEIFRDNAEFEIEVHALCSISALRCHDSAASQR